MNRVNVAIRQTLIGPSLENNIRFRRSFLFRSSGQEIMRAFFPMLGLALLGLVAAGPAPGSENLHERMTTEEFKKVFNSEPHAVPEYDVVPVHWPRLHKRAQGSTTKIRLNAFGRNIKLWLNPTEGVLIGRDTPVYLAKSDSSTKLGIRILKATDAMATTGDLLEDREKQASLLVKRSASGRTLISGHVASEGWVVRPLPERLSSELSSRYRRSIVDDFKNITIGDSEPEYHVIYKNPELPDEADYITMPLPDDIINNKAIRSKRSAPSVIYPQVLVMVDYGTYKLYDEYIYDLLEYLVPFWNGVDLRYRSLEFPKVRLNIAGIVVGGDARAFSFITKNKVGPNTLNIFGALDSLGLYMRTTDGYFPPETYDITVAMAPYDMCSPNDDGTCQVGTLGLAYLSGACALTDYKTPKTLSVTVIQDKGGFDGMHTAAHEMGHLFGASHDGQDGSLCSAEEGHVMAPSPVLTENSADWSRCTMNNFNEFFNHKDPKCLYNEPKSKSPLPRVLPGKLLTIDEQCAKIEGTKGCKLEENVCMRLRCIYKKDNNYCTDVGDAAADGSTCGDGKICVHGKCLVEKDIQ